MLGQLTAWFLDFSIYLSKDIDPVGRCRTQCCFACVRYRTFASSGSQAHCSGFISSWPGQFCRGRGRKIQHLGRTENWRIICVLLSSFWTEPSHLVISLHYGRRCSWRRAGDCCFRPPDISSAHLILQSGIWGWKVDVYRDDLPRSHFQSVASWPWALPHNESPTICPGFFSYIITVVSTSTRSL